MARPDGLIRDRDGELIEDTPTPAPPALVHSCEGGWLGVDEEGRPRPCLVCRPHLPKRWARSRARRRWWGL